MRKILFACLILISGIFVNAQDILYVSGYVTDIETNEPIIGKEVFAEAIAPSGFYYYNVIITYSVGYYNDEINIGEETEGEISLSTFDCNYMKQLFHRTI